MYDVVFLQAVYKENCFLIQVVGCTTLKVTGLLCRLLVFKCVESFCKSSVRSLSGKKQNSLLHWYVDNVAFLCSVSGLWLEAAELIWASLVGYYALPQPDKKVSRYCHRSCHFMRLVNMHITVYPLL